MVLELIGGAIAYAAGFAPIGAGSLAANIMSWSWTTGIGTGAVAALQSAAATFGNTVAAMTL